MEKTKEKILKILETVERDGIKNLIAWLISTDFFDAPATVSYFDCYEGGLARHSLKTYLALKQLQKAFPRKFEGISEESLIIVGLLHDVSNVSFYKKGTKNVKNDDGQWESVPCYSVEDGLSMEAGTKTLFRLQKYIALSEDEAVAIATAKVSKTSVSYYTGMKNCPLAVLLDAANAIAAYLCDGQ